MKKTHRKHPKNKVIHHAAKHSHWVFALVVFTFNLLVWIGVPRSTSAAVEEYPWPHEERAFVDVVNASRASEGDPALIRSGCLTEAARDWSRTMADANTLYHSSLQAQVTEFCGSVGAGVGEIVGRTTASGTAQQMFAAFEASPPHNGVMHNAAYDYVGVGWLYDVTHTTVWVTGIFFNCASGGCPAAVTSTPSDPVSGLNSSCNGMTLQLKEPIGPNFWFGATLSFQNTGGTVWYGNSIGAISKSPDGNNFWGRSSGQLGAGSSSYRVDPGRYGWVQLNLRAPPKRGAFTFAWRLMSNGSQFGAVCSKTIQIDGLAADGPNVEELNSQPGSSAGGGSSGSSGTDGSGSTASGESESNAPVGSDPLTHGPANVADKIPGTRLPDGSVVGPDGEILTPEQAAALEKRIDVHVNTVDLIRFAPIIMKLAMSPTSLVVLGVLLVIRRHIFGFHFPHVHLPLTK